MGQTNRNARAMPMAGLLALALLLLLSPVLAGCGIPAGTGGEDADEGAGSGETKGSSAAAESSGIVDASQVPMPPVLDPADVVAGIDNPFMPLTPGRIWTYEAKTDAGTERTVVEVQTETRKVMGIDAVVVHDTVMLNGQLIEDTFDWYAQDRAGKVWYLGEEVSNYEDGVYVDSHGAWEAGVDGALPGIVMWADPQPGEPYRQEYLAGEAEDIARIQKRDGKATIAYGDLADLLVTLDWNPLDPESLPEQKFYARGIGLVLELAVGGDERVELVDLMEK
jgi:hypothetical protein